MRRKPLTTTGAAFPDVAPLRSCRAARAGREGAQATKTPCRSGRATARRNAGICLSRSKKAPHGFCDLAGLSWRFGRNRPEIHISFCNYLTKNFIVFEIPSNIPTKFFGSPRARSLHFGAAAWGAGPAGKGHTSSSCRGLCPFAGPFPAVF